MKSKSYTKINTWLVVVTIVVALCALNPGRAKRIACKFAVVFELYEDVKTCQYGCPSKKTNSRQKKVRKNQKTEDCQCNAGNATRLSLVSFGYEDITLPEVIPLIALLAIWLTQKVKSSRSP